LNRCVERKTVCVNRKGLASFTVSVLPGVNDSSVCEVLYSLTVSQVIPPLANVPSAIGPHVRSLTVVLAALEFTDVLGAISHGVRSLTVVLAALEFTDVLGASCQCKSPKTICPPFLTALTSWQRALRVNTACHQAEYKKVS
jgi:hypothetical protein